jgi:hypothetical protein
MPMISTEKMQTIKQFIFRHGRLLECQQYEYFFGIGSKDACERALQAYQNDDGGVGNGIEPDLLYPGSTAIGAETALVTMDWLGVRESSILSGLTRWVERSLDERGVIPHPPPGISNYPCAPWWTGADDNRILAIAALLKRMGITNEHILSLTAKYAAQKPVPSELAFYDYPFLLYYMNCGQTTLDTRTLQTIVAQLPTLLTKYADYYPLFSRYWSYAAEFVTPDVLEKEARAFVDAIQDDGGMRTAYPDLPWWRPIMTLDGLIQLKRHAFI